MESLREVPLLLVFREARVYLKVGAAVLLLAFAVVFVLANLGNKAEVWFGKQFSDVASSWLVICSAVGGIVVWQLLRWLSSLPRQWRSVRERR